MSSPAAPRSAAAPGYDRLPAGVPPDLLARVQRHLAQTGQRPDPAVLAAAVRAESTAVLGDAELLVVLRRLERELGGAGPLTPLLAEPDTTDVVVNGPADVRVDRGRGWEPAPVTFADEAAVTRLARRLAVAAGQRLDEAHPYVDGRLPDGTRLHAVLAPLAGSGTCLSLRVLRPARLDLAALTDGGLFPGVTAAVVRAVLAARLAFVVTGGTGSGKTTLLDAMLGAVDRRERILVVEDAEELRPAHPHVIRLVARPANVEGAGAIGMRELVRQALRMRPDRVVVGEVRGAEVIDLLAALNCGHDGGAGTLHANSAADVPARIAALAALGGMSGAALDAQIAAALHVVLHVRRTRAGRRLSEIAVLTRSPGGTGDAPGGIVAVPVVAGGRPTDRIALLGRLLEDRGVRPPW